MRPFRFAAAADDFEVVESPFLAVAQDSVASKPSRGDHEKRLFVETADASSRNSASRCGRSEGDPGADRRDPAARSRAMTKKASNRAVTHDRRARDAGVLLRRLRGGDPIFSPARRWSHASNRRAGTFRKELFKPSEFFSTTLDTRLSTRRLHRPMHLCLPGNMALAAPAGNQAPAKLFVPYPMFNHPAGVPVLSRTMLLSIVWHGGTNYICEESGHGGSKIIFCVLEDQIIKSCGMRECYEAFVQGYPSPRVRGE
ncbi:MAG: hypothetical protein BJ554DRAFT_1354, partial [Olpidium bornovanus]